MYFDSLDAFLLDGNRYAMEIPKKSLFSLFIHVSPSKTSAGLATSLTHQSDFGTDIFGVTLKDCAAAVILSYR